MEVIFGLIGVAYAIFLLVLPFLIIGINRRLREMQSAVDAVKERSEAQIHALAKRVEETETLRRERLEAAPSVRSGAADVMSPGPISPAPEVERWAAVDRVTGEQPPVAVEMQAPVVQPPPAEPAIPAVASSPPPELLILEGYLPPRDAGEAAAPPALPLKPSVFEQLRERLREQMASQEWEAMVGGSWLNKLGMLILVIGLALFLGYSLAYLGPAGRIAVGFVVSGVILACGVVLERRARYVMFARGLIGGGWAALYFTTYAMHGLEASRVIEDPLVGMLLLGAAAVGMVVHSLRYRSEIVTGLAYFIGFVTIAISPVSGFSVAASVPLAGSLLFLAHKFSWVNMAVAGVIATYGTYALGYGALAATGPVLSNFLSGQSALVIYWLLFEGFDLLGIWRGRELPAVERAIFPLNACGFVGVSLLYWPSFARETLYLFFAAAGAAYLVSTLIRAKLSPPSSFPEDADIAKRIAAGGYEGAVTLAVALITLGILLRLSGLEVNLALMLEGEFLLLAGLRLGQPYLRLLAAVVFAYPLIKLGLLDLVKEEVVAIAGTSLKAWTPVALVMSSVFYLNRWLTWRGQPVPLAFLEVGYGFAATALLALILAFEVPLGIKGFAWLLLAVPLFEVGLRKGFEEFRTHSFLVAVTGLLALLLVNVIGAGIDAMAYVWTSLAPAAILVYYAAVRVHTLSSDRLADPERENVRLVSSWAGTVLLAAVAWYVLPRAYVGLGWLALAVPLFEVGLGKGLVVLRAEAYTAAGLGLAAQFTLFFINVSGVTVGEARDSWISLGTAALLAYAAFARLQLLAVDRLTESERHPAWGVSSVAGTALVTALLWHVLPIPVIAVGWGVVSLLLIELGFALALPLLRLQGFVVAALAFGRLFLANFTGMGETFGVSHRILTVLPLIALFYYSWWKIRIEGERGQLARWERLAATLCLYAPVILAVALIRFEAGRVMAVIGWALLGLGLLTVGVRWNNRDLRWQSYAVAALTFGRCWATNFYIPESLAGVFDRAVTGGVVTLSFYACQFLSPRRGEAGLLVEGNWFRRRLIQFDAHGRTVFSLLATTLFTVLLFYEVSGNLLTVAWALEGVALLSAGFLMRERVMRLCGLLLLAACVLKVFVYDFRELEALFRILSFVVIGLLLVGVSLIYTRFREQLRRYF